jgi:hypothetical protein
VDNDILAEGNITTFDKFVFAPDNDINSERWEISRTENGLNYAYHHQAQGQNDKSLDISNFLFIANDGRIGISNTSPTVNLDVNGSFKSQSANVTGTITGNALSAQSATITGAFTANGATITGALSAQSATIPTITGNTNVTGTLTASALNVQSARIDGTLCTKEVQVAATPCWPDFVFEEDYPLMSLPETEQFIKANKHLPNVPSAAEVEANGIHLGEMNAILIQKVEELTLYILDLQNQINELKYNKP